MGSEMCIRDRNKTKRKHLHMRLMISIAESPNEAARMLDLELKWLRRDGGTGLICFRKTQGRFTKKGRSYLRYTEPAGGETERRLSESGLDHLFINICVRAYLRYIEPVWAWMGMGMCMCMGICVCVCVCVYACVCVCVNMCMCIRLFNDLPTIAKRFPNEFPTSFQRVPNDCPTMFQRFSNNAPMVSQ